jgi:hypothetical protein
MNATATTFFQFARAKNPMSDAVSVVVRIRPEGDPSLHLTHCGEPSESGECSLRVSAPPEGFDDNDYDGAGGGGGGSRTPGKPSRSCSRTPSKGTSASSSTPWKTPRRPAAKNFAFDAVLDGQVDNAAAFETCAPLVSSALDGINGTIFAYGSTGSGKTHSMMGGGGDPGVIPRAVAMLFDEIGRRGATVEGDPSTEAGHGIEYEVRLSFVELYNNRFRDLLHQQPGRKGLSRRHSETSTASSSSSSSGAKPFLGDTPAPLEIKRDRHGMSLQGSDTLRQRVDSAAEAMALVDTGKRARVTAETALNGASSRSHAILCLNVASTDGATGVSRRAKLYIIDLAGSEQLAASADEKSDSTAAETLAINLSLTALANVLSALSKQGGNGNSGNSSQPQQELWLVPYRDSKLTHLLRDSLGGTARTVMLAHVRPTPAHHRQTLQTLAYAARARLIVAAPAAKLDMSGAVGGGKLSAAELARATEAAVAKATASLRSELESAAAAHAAAQATLSEQLGQRDERVAALEKEHVQLRRLADPHLFEQLSRMRAALDDTIAKASEDAAFAAAELEAADAAAADAKDQAAAKLKATALAAQEESHKHAGEALVLRDECTGLATKLATLRDDGRSRGVALAALQGELEATREAAASAAAAQEAQRAKLEAQRDALVKRLTAAGGASDERAASVSVAAAKLASQLAAAQQRCAELESLDADQRRLREFAGKGKARAEEESGRLGEELQQARARVAELEAESARLQKALSMAEAAATARAAEAKAAGAQLTEARAAAAAAEAAAATARGIADAATAAAAAAAKTASATATSAPAPPMSTSAGELLRGWSRSPLPSTPDEEAASSPSPAPSARRSRRSSSTKKESSQKAAAGTKQPKKRSASASKAKKTLVVQPEPVLEEVAEEEEECEEVPPLRKAVAAASTRKRSRVSAAVSILDDDDDQGGTAQAKPAAATKRPRRSTARKTSYAELADEEQLVRAPLSPCVVQPQAASTAVVEAGKGKDKAAPKRRKLMPKHAVAAGGVGSFLSGMKGRAMKAPKLKLVGGNKENA